MVRAHYSAITMILTNNNHGRKLDQIEKKIDELEKKLREVLKELQLKKDWKTKI